MTLIDRSQEKPLLIAFSHLRWDFVFQRPQQLLTRAAKDFDVIFLEEPIFEGSALGRRESNPHPGVQVVQPLIPHGTPPTCILRILENLVLEIAARARSAPLVLWYYTPMAFAFSRSVSSDLIVFDKMDELSAFAFAPPGLIEQEAALMSAADIVFTGGASLFAAASGRHPNLHCFPSSIDALHFGKGRFNQLHDPDKQRKLVRPRMGFFGVIDERIDLGLIASVARLRPELQLVMVGPTAKIDPVSLPQADNIHWVGPSSYADLPAYMAHWDLGWMPFALNGATRFISPTKTPEFLAAGLPLISTAITDVIEPYGRLGLVKVVCGAQNAVDTIDSLLSEAANPLAKAIRLKSIDRHLSGNSWDNTWTAMRELMAEAAFPVSAPVSTTSKSKVRHV